MRLKLYWGIYCVVSWLSEYLEECTHYWFCKWDELRESDSTPDDQTNRKDEK